MIFKEKISSRKTTDFEESILITKGNFYGAILPKK
jgi:hypothetical protein